MLDMPVHHREAPLIQINVDHNTRISSSQVSRLTSLHSSTPRGQQPPHVDFRGEEPNHNEDQESPDEADNFLMSDGEDGDGLSDVESDDSDEGLEECAD